MADCTDYPTPEDAKRFKNNAGSVDEFVTSDNDTFVDQDGGEHITVTGIDTLAENQRDQFDATFQAQFTYKHIGNISDYVDDLLSESEKLNSYQYPDDSGEWYGPIQSQTFPVTIPADPTVDEGWVLTSNVSKQWVAETVSNTNLLSNHNFLIQTPDDSQPLPSATPTSYPPGYQIFSGVFANETTGITNLTYIDGRVSFSGGDLYFSVPNTGAIARLTSDQLTASVADFDGKPRTRGVSFSLVGDEYRVTVGIDALEDAGAVLTPLGSVKFEHGSVATGHETESLSSRNLSDYTDIVYSDVENMIAGIPLVAEVGIVCSTGGSFWISKAVSSPRVIEDFERLTEIHASAVGITQDSPDNLAALLSFISDYSKPTGNGFNVQCPVLKFTEGVYKFSAPIDLKARVFFVGETSSKLAAENGTVFEFPKVGDGVRVHRYNTTGNGEVQPSPTTGADGSIIQGITVKTIESNTKGVLFDTSGTLAVIKTQQDLSNSSMDISTVDSANYDADVIAKMSVEGNVTTNGNVTEICRLSGTFVFNETVTGGTSGATATVAFVSTNYDCLILVPTSGTFTEGETITGGASSASGIHLNDVHSSLMSVYSYSLSSGSLSSDDVHLMREEGTYGSGFVLFARANTENCAALGFSEHGIKVVSPGAYPAGNANLSLFSKFYASNLGGHGLFFSGGDSNTCMAEDINIIGANGFAVYDNSFLGNRYNRCHAASNNLGAYWSGDNTDRASTFDDAYSESSSPRAPYPPYCSVISGSSILIGGTQGAPVKKSFRDKEIDLFDNGNCVLNPRKEFKYRGLEYGDIGSDLSNVGLKVRGRGTSLKAVTIAAESTSGRVTQVFESPFQQSSAPTGEISTFVSGASSSSMVFGVRDSRSSGTYGTATVGSGAAIYLEISGGIITNAEVLKTGSGYDKTTTVSVTITSGDLAGTGAELKPVVNSGLLTDVIVVNGGSGYTDTVVKDRLSLTRQSLSPTDDNSMDLGTGALRVKTIHLVNAPSVTSDERLKTPLEDVSDIEKRVADKIVIKKYKYLESVSNKGEEAARVHFGVGAQSVIAAFESEGLSPFDYALIRKVEWDAEMREEFNEDGSHSGWEELSPPGWRYEIVETELLMFLMSIK